MENTHHTLILALAHLGNKYFPAVIKKVEQSYSPTPRGAALWELPELSGKAEPVVISLLGDTARPVSHVATV